MGFEPAADLRVTLWAMALGAFTVLASAMAPGLSVTRSALQATLRESGKGLEPRHGRSQGGSEYATPD